MRHFSSNFGCKHQNMLKTLQKILWVKVLLPTEFFFYSWKVLIITLFYFSATEFTLKGPFSFSEEYFSYCDFSSNRIDEIRDSIKKKAFQDNMNIYMLLIITFCFYFILMIWATWKDIKDRQKVRKENTLHSS